jgi:hypothetical protein
MQLSHRFKGQLSELPAAAISIVVLVIVVSMGILVLAGMNNSTTNTAAQTVIGKGMTGLGTFGDWFSTIIIVIIAVVILALVMGFFAMRGRGTA